MADSQVNLRISTDASAAVAGLRKVSDGLGNLQSIAMRATGILGTYFSVGAIKDLADIGVKALQAETAFKNATDNLGIDAKKWVETLKEATKGTIDESDIMQKAMKGITGGLSQDQITEIAKLATTTATRMGIDVKDAYADIVDAVEMMRTKTLVKFGLITKAQGEIADSAKRAGEEVDMFRIIMENAANQKALVGALDETALKFQQAKAASHDLWESMGKEIAGLIGEIYTVGNLVKNLFSEKGREANIKLGAEKLSKLAEDASYMPGPFGGMVTPKTPYLDTLKGAEARKKAADEAKRQAEMIQKVVDNLKFELAQLQRTDQEQAIYNSLKAAGVSIDSKAGQQIADLATKTYEYKETQKEGIKEAELWTKNYMEIEKERQVFIDSMAKEITSLEREMEVFGMNTTEATLYKLALEGATSEQLKLAEAFLVTIDKQERLKKLTEELITPQETYNARVKELKEALDGFSITWDQYTTGMEKARESLASATKEQKTELSDLQKAIEGWGKHSSDAIVDFAMTGKTSFSDMINSMIADMLKMLVYQNMMKPLFGTISGWFAPGGTGAQAGYSMLPGVEYHTGGIVGEVPRLHKGLMPGEYPAILQKGEGVFTPAQMKALGGSKVTVNIINNAGAEVSTQSKNTSGGMELDVIIDRAVASKLGQFGSSSNKVMRQNFNTSQRLINR